MATKTIGLMAYYQEQNIVLMSTGKDNTEFVVKFGFMMASEIIKALISFPKEEEDPVFVEGLPGGGACDHRVYR